MIASRLPALPPTLLPRTPPSLLRTGVWVATPVEDVVLVRQGTRSGLSKASVVDARREIREPVVNEVLGTGRVPMTTRLPWRPRTKAPASPVVPAVPTDGPTGVPRVVQRLRPSRQADGRTRPAEDYDNRTVNVALVNAVPG